MMGDLIMIRHFLMFISINLRWREYLSKIALNAPAVKFGLNEGLSHKPPLWRIRASHERKMSELDGLYTYL